jgi:hypothetical protein
MNPLKVLAHCPSVSVVAAVLQPACSLPGSCGQQALSKAQFPLVVIAMSAFITVPHWAAHF